MNKKNIKKLLDGFKSTTVKGSKRENSAVVSTGIPLIDDYLLNCGGFGRGRGIEISGENSCGKSSLVQVIAANIQKAGGLVAWADPEPIEPQYAEACGLNMKEVYFPEDLGYGEDYLYWIRQMLATNVFDIIVLDSLAALNPKGVAQASLKRGENMKTDMEASKMVARFCAALDGGYEIYNDENKKVKSNIIHKVSNKDGKQVDSDTIHKLVDKKTTLVLINHQRLQFGTYVPTTRTSAGDRKDFLFTTRIGIRTSIKMKTVQGKKELKYKAMTLKCTKNKLGIPLRKIKLLLYPDGIIEEGKIEQEDVEEVTTEPHPDSLATQIKQEHINMDTVETRNVKDIL